MFQEPLRMTLRKLLACEKISIPIYQRGYAWGDDEVADYVGDLSDLIHLGAGKNQEHFLGMMLCYNRADERWTRVLEVIDGQQRLTTSSILLAGVRKALTTAAESEHATENVKREAKSQVQTLNALLFAQHGGQSATKLSLNEKDQDEWARIAQEATCATGEQYDALPVSAQRLNAALRTLTDELIQKGHSVDSEGAVEGFLDHLKRITKATLDSLSFVLLTADNEKSVYDLFMTINDRGKALSPFDLIRTGTLSKLQSKRTSFDRAKLLLGPLMEVDDEESRRALTFFVNSFSGTRIAKNALLKQLSQWLYSNEGKDSFHTELVSKTKQMADGTEYLIELTKKKPDWLGSAYPFSGDAIGAERQHRLLAALRHDSCKPLLVAGRELLSGGAFREMLGVLERIALRAFLTNGVHKSLLADFHIEQARRLRENPQTWSPQQLWLDALSANLGEGRKTISLAENCSDALFKEGVKKLEWRNNRGLIAYILLGIDSFDFDEKRPGNEHTFHWAEIHLDHIVAQSLRDDPVVRAGPEHSIGNLTPLSGRKNSKMKNNPYGREKSSIYKQSKVFMTRSIGVDHEEQWSVTDAKNRLADIAEKACIVWNIHPDTWK